jgi:hypothetical protein
MRTETRWHIERADGTRERLRLCAVTETRDGYDWTRWECTRGDEDVVEQLAYPWDEDPGEDAVALVFARRWYVVALVREVVERPEPADIAAWHARLREAVGAWLLADEQLGACTIPIALASVKLDLAEEAVRAAYAEPEPRERVVESTREAIAREAKGDG